jgi:glycosyltransferase involved in cell wall biosynthesis
MDRFSFTSEPMPGLVSIVIPTYRKDQYIGETLESIGGQTYGDWELIVVEDSSVGRTEQIVADFARRHPNHRVDYCRNDRNRGAAHSRNVAFAKCRGEFVALIDADDRWFPEHLAHSVEALRDPGHDLVYSSTVMVEDGTDRLLEIGGPKDYELTEFPDSLFRRNFITPSATVMRRDVLADVGPWNTAMKYCEDQDFWLRCIRAGKQFHLIGGCHCLYRKNHDGATTQKDSGTNEEFAEIVERFIPMPGTSESRVRRYVAKAYRRAAECHHRQHSRDPSADPSRCAMLLYKAWRVQPKRLDNLVRMLRYSVVNRLRKPIRKPDVVQTNITSKRAAA